MINTLECLENFEGEFISKLTISDKLDSSVNLFVFYYEDKYEGVKHALLKAIKTNEFAKGVLLHCPVIGCEYTGGELRIAIDRNSHYEYNEEDNQQLSTHKKDEVPTVMTVGDLKRVLQTLNDEDEVCIYDPLSFSIDSVCGYLINLGEPNVLALTKEYWSTRDDTDE